MISKFQQGGGFESLFTIYKPIQTETPRRATASSRRSEPKDDKEDTKGKLTEKDLFDMLEKLDGLPNEMQIMLGNMMTTLNNAKALGVTDIQDLANVYLRNLYSLKEAKYNKEQYDNTYKQAVSNKSLNDVAIDQSGTIYVTDSNGGLRSFSPEQWVKVKDSNEYQILTNGNLLWMRSHLPKYANKNQLLRIVENGIGIEEVHKMIKDRFQKIGTTETSTDTFMPQKVAKGQQILAQMVGLGPEGYYKFSQELSQPDKNQINATLNYIYNTLPANAKTRLAIETQDGKPESVINLIESLIIGTTDTKSNYSAQYIGTQSKLNGESDQGKMNIAEKLIAGYGAPETFGINIGDENLTMVKANTLPLVGSGDKDLGIRKPISDVIQSSLGRILNLQSASIGGQIISSFDLNRVITQDGKIRTIDFPCIQNENGTIVPNISPEVRKRKKEADAELKQMGIDVYDSEQSKTSYQTINQVYQKHQLNPPYSSSGKLNQNWARFAILAVATDGNVVKGNTSLLQEITDDYEAESIVSAIQESDTNYKFNKGMFGLWGDSIYKGVMWVPLFESYNMATASDKIDASTAMQKDIQDQNIQNKTQLSTEQIY